MAGMISRDAALDVIVTEPNFHNILTLIEELPAVDAVPVVRCSACKFGKLCLDANGHRLIQCTNTKYPTANVETWPLELDWYCAGGERRDGDT